MNGEVEFETQVKEIQNLFFWSPYLHLRSGGRGGALCPWAVGPTGAQGDPSCAWGGGGGCCKDWDSLFCGLSRSPLALLRREEEAPMGEVSSAWIASLLQKQCFSPTFTWICSSCGVGPFIGGPQGQGGLKELTRK